MHKMVAALGFILYFSLVQANKLKVELGLTPKFTCLEKFLVNWWGKRNVILAERLENLDILEDFDYVPPHVSMLEPRIEQLINTLDEKVNCYFISISSIDFLEKVLQIIIESEIFKLASYVIVVEPEVNLQLVAETLWNYRLPHALLLLLSKNQTLNIYKLKIMDCGGAVVPENLLTLHQQTNNCTYLKTLPNFDFKMTFFGCPLKVLWSHYPPFIYPPNNPYGWKGIFIDFLEPLPGISGRYLTFSTDDSDYFDEIATGFTFDAVMQDMQNESQLFVGPTEIRTHAIFHLSPVIIDDDFLLIAPRPLRDYLGDLLSIKRLHYLIGGLVIFGVFGVLLAGLYNVGSFSKSEEKGIAEIWFMMFGYLLGSSGFGRVKPKGLLRICLGMLLFTCLVLNIYFQGMLLRTFSGSLYGAPYSTIESLIESKLPVKMPALAGNYLQAMSESQEDMSQLLKNFEPIDDSLSLLTNIDKLIEDRNFATCAVKAILLMKPNYEKLFGTFTYFKINLALAMKKNDYSAPPLYKWISRMLESGIFEKYEKIHFAQLAWKFSLDAPENNYVLTLRKLKPVLNAYFASCLGCFGVFLLEILYFNLCRLVYRGKLLSKIRTQKFK